MTLKHIDIHSHLNFSQFDEDREAIIAEMKDVGMATICVGTDKKTSAESVELAAQHDNIYATVGIHPTHLEEGYEDTRIQEKADGLFDIAYYESLLGPKVVAVGECGLDYFRPPFNKEKQKELFIQQIKFAQKHHLPLMLHCRASKGTQDAYEDALDILASYPDVKGDFHFFVGDVSIAKRAVERGFTLSFDGPITFASDYDETIKSIPADMIMAETDAPFAAPVPHRGKRNSPLFVTFVSDRLADIRGEDREAFREQTVENAKRVFGLGSN